MYVQNGFMYIFDKDQAQLYSQREGNPRISDPIKDSGRDEPYDLRPVPRAWCCQLAEGSAAKFKKGRIFCSGNFLKVLLNSSWTLSKSLYFFHLHRNK